ncbi:hypothetical protein LUZ60_005268 [Juncus effusus]|nr:hypothetical protein LUZ60_005268 [Juncus effusus]
METLFISSLALSPDGEVLMELKTAFNDTKTNLRSWKRSDPNPCGWTGISCSFPDLRVRSINLPYMQLSGVIPPSIGKLQKLQRLALHQNSLHGSIPTEIKNCTGLKALYLRANYLQGGIPPEIGDLNHLTILDLSSNLLRGTIPPTIGRLTNLRFLNLSTNFFSGEIPNVGVLATFRSTSYVGNLELCGLPIQKDCRSALGFPAVLPHPDSIISPGVSPMETNRTSHFLNGVIIGSMSTMAFALVLILVFLWICMLSRKRSSGGKYVKMDKNLAQDSSTKLVTYHGNLPYTSTEILNKIDLLEESDIVGSGGFGTVYKMTMDDNISFAVKRIEERSSKGKGQDGNFEKELEILGSIRHINLVNLRGFCRVPTGKLLIYDFLELGSLDRYLHEGGQDDQPLNWNARMKIALGSARGLAYLHHDCSPAIIHRDIKSSNVLLDLSLEPHVSDFGLAKLLVDQDCHVTTVVAGTFGYLAPEYMQNGRVTEKSDVYSFGVLLLELVTGKRPTDPSFVNRGLNIVGWLNTLTGEHQLDEILDITLTGDDVAVEEVEAVLDIAAMCTDANPERRPAMNRVLKMLEEEILSPCLSESYYDESHLDI